MADYASNSGDTGDGVNIPPLVRTARDCFEQGQQASRDQRARNLKALRFYNDDQWPEDIKMLRAGTQGNANQGQPPVPARPCITINRVKEPVKQVVNQMRSSDMGAEIVPADDFGDMQEIDETEIELREGLLRRIQRAPETTDAILWMGSRAAICGEGYMGVMCRYLPGKTFDQEPYVHRFYNQSSVMLDPAHEQPDGSDAEWGIVGTDMPWPQYVAEFAKLAGRKNYVCDTTDEQFRALGDEAPKWFDYAGSGTDDTEGTSKKTRMCRVVDYYYTVRESKELCELEDGSVYWRDELPTGAKPRQSRYVVEKSIKWAKIDGCQILDQGDWAGPDIPIIKCLGEEIHPYDDERRSVGMVSASAQEANFSGNVMVSKMVETIGLAPIAQLMMANGQDEGFEPEIAQINTRTFGVLHYNIKDAEGNMVGPPQPVPITTQIAPIVTALQFFNESVLSVIGQPSPTLGEVDPSIKTKGGLERLLDQAAHGNSNYLDNLAKSVRRMAVILNGLFYPLLGTKPGRLARIIDGEGESHTVVINGPAPAPQQGATTKPPRVLKLTKDAKLNVAIKVTKNYDTRRDQQSTMLGELIGSNPEFMTWFGDKFLKSTDIPDHKELEERAKVMLAPPIQKMLAEKAEGTPIPPHAQAKIARAEQLVQQLTEANQQLLKERETDGIKQQAETQRAQMEAQNKAAIEQLKAMSQQQLTALKLEFEAWKTEFEARQAALTREDEQRHEMALKAAEAAQAAKDAEAQRQHDANMGRQAAEAGELGEQAGHHRAIEQGDRSHAQNLEAQAQKPNPAGGSNGT